MKRHLFSVCHSYTDAKDRQMFQFWVQKTFYARANFHYACHPSADMTMNCRICWLFILKLPLYKHVVFWLHKWYIQRNSFNHRWSIYWFLLTMLFYVFGAMPFKKLDGKFIKYKNTSWCSPIQAYTMPFTIWQWPSKEAFAAWEVCVPHEQEWLKQR